MSAKNTAFRYLAVFISLIFYMESVPLHAASMQDYCIVPPYVQRDSVKPNILLLMDNAEVMGEAAYADMTTYNPATNYIGLFKNTIMYTYTGSSWRPDAAGIYSGNLLNWVTTSKYDLLQNILLGGKSASRQASNVNTLVSISNSWTKTLTYRDSLGALRVCKFVVSGANVQVRDDTPDSCGYLDVPAKPLVAWNENDLKYASGVPADARTEAGTVESMFKGVVRQTFSLLNDFMDFLVPDAEAAAPLRIPPGDPPDATECTPYAASISASGGSEAGYTWSLISGSLPPGLAMVGGTPQLSFSGTPTGEAHTAPAPYPDFQVQVCDSLGACDTASLNIGLLDATVDISTTSPLQEGYSGAYYYAPISATGPCSASYTTTLASGSLPPLCSISLNHVLCPESLGVTPGTYNFTLQVRDSKANTKTKAFTLTIRPSLVGFQISSGSPLTSGTKDVPYFVYIESANGSDDPALPGTGYTWSISSGSLPPGLTFTGGAGGYFTSISGTPTTVGVFAFTVRVVDFNGAVATKDFSMEITRRPPVVRYTANLSVKVCAGDYVVNCSNPDTVAPYDPPCSETYPDMCVLKTGIIDQFWTQARYGLQDFGKVASAAVPTLSKCIESTPGDNPSPDFVDAVQNAIPIPLITTLVNGEHFAIVDHYADEDGVNCDPFRDVGNQGPCMRNFVLMITSGTGANNPPDPAAAFTPLVETDATNCGGANLVNLAKNSCFGYNNDLRSGDFGATDLVGRQVVNTYIVNTMGAPKTSAGTDCPDTPVSTGDMLCQAAVVGGGVYYEVVDPTALKDTLIQAFQDILKRAAAGTAASVLASGEGSGANLIQAVFYPRRKVGNVEIGWTGRLTNFWFYVDPFFSTSSIYEDNAGAGFFNLGTDNRVSFYYDNSLEKTMAHRYPASGSLDDIEFEALNTLWEAGYRLWERSADSRVIKVPLQTGLTEDPADSGLANFSAGNASVLGPFLALNATYGDLDNSGAVDDTDAELLIRYMRGEDFPAYTWLRRREVTIGGVSHIWKLSDILNSTPKISSWVPLGTYDQTYIDASYKNYYTSSTYTNRGMVFAGGNDGMLHAFKLGKLELREHPTNCVFGSGDLACIANPAGYLGGSGTPIGEEMWAFMPKNALPYLKYIKETDYCHVFTVDLSPYVFDASIGAPGSGDISGDAKPVDGSTWRTILIGGMRFGGACKNTCGSTDCVATPANNLGYSSYFALDITNQASPTLLWEFSSEDLGFTTTGPAVIKVGDRATNAKWLVVFGSGPTGPVNTTHKQFLGRSDQNLRLFILDLKTGSLVRTIDTGIANAFAGSMINTSLDANQNYQDDLLYVPYVRKAADNTWTEGGVYRLLTTESTAPADWVPSTFIDGVGPVTSAVTRLLNVNKRQLWVFFGAGRYYFEQADQVDDQDGQRTLYGLKEPCYTTSGLDDSCVAAFSGTITDVTSAPNTDPGSIADGWMINMDPSGSYQYCDTGTGTCGGASPTCTGSCVTRPYRAERVITDPIATTTGLVFFTTYKPYDDVCAYGGKSFVWAVKYNAGSAPGAALKGIGLLQVSTGSIEQIDLESGFAEKGGRRTTAMEGVPPTSSGLSLLSTPPPVKRMLHMKER